MNVIGFSYNAGGLTKKKGVELGPKSIIDYTQQFYLKENNMLAFMESNIIEVPNDNIGKAQQLIQNKAAKTMLPSIFLGGDHSLTYATVKGVVDQLHSVGLLVFDAHIDAENSFSPPSHEDYLRSLVEEKVIDPKKIVIVGIRNMHQNELEFYKKHNLKLYTMKEIMQEGIQESADAIMAAVRSWKNLYVSVDIDVLDPAFAPGTGYTEPGGLTSRELIYFIQRLKNLQNIRAWDLVEVNPTKDINNITVALAAKLVVEMC